MGWAAFKATKQDGSTINLIFPKVEKPFELSTGIKTMADLLSYPDYPVEAMLLLQPEQVEAAKNFGFGNYLNVREFFNLEPGDSEEILTLGNGSTIHIKKHYIRANFITWEFSYYNKDGKVMTNWVQGSNAITDGKERSGFNVLFLPCLVGDDRESIIYPSTKSSSENGILIDDNNKSIPSVLESDLHPLDFFKDATPIYITSDPYGDGGMSETGGGGGDFDNTSTPIQIPGLPSISASSTGFISLYNPSLSQLNQLASYLWSDLFDVNGWKKLFANPMDAILGLSIVPVAVPSGGTREVKVGNIGTGISLTVASSQFVKVDCGSIDVNEYWGAYLDYEPYTQAQIFLPYIGTRPISVDDIMGKSVSVVYHVDILTGACCCFVKCGDSVLYTYNGQCSIPIPITGANYTSVVNGVISIAASVGSLVATGGSSAPTAIPAIASSAVNQMKPQVEKSGSISGSAGVLNMQTPYLILIRPRQALPSKQNEFIGYPSLITVQLTELKGYTEVQSIHLENIPATQEELAEIESLLKGGVIF